MFKTSIQTLHRISAISRQNLGRRILPILYQPNCTASSNTSQPNAEDSSQIWTKLYQFHTIHHLSVLSRVKIFQAVAAVIGTPTAFGLEYFNAALEGVTIMFATMGFGGLIMISAYSALVANIIGIVYVDASNKNLRFAYLDFWGNRRHLDLKTTDVYQSKEHKRIGPITLFKVKCSGEKTKQFKLLPLHGDVYDNELFSKLFEEK